MNPLIFIRLARAIVENKGHTDPSSATPSDPGRVFHDGRITIFKRQHPPELAVFNGQERVLHLHGGNLLHWDEDKTVTDRLISLVRDDGVILDIIADEDIR